MSGLFLFSASCVLPPVTVFHIFPFPDSPLWEYSQYHCNIPVCAVKPQINLLLNCKVQKQTCKLYVTDCSQIMRVSKCWDWTTLLGLSHAEVTLFHLISCYPLLFTTCNTNTIISSACIWASSRQKVSSGVSDQVRHKTACAATEASYSLEMSAIESRDIILSEQRVWCTFFIFILILIYIPVSKQRPKNGKLGLYGLIKQTTAT